MSALPVPPAPTLRRPSRLPTAAAAILALLGVVLLGQGAWMHAKARLAQALLESAFGTSLTTGQAVKPWSWADTWPVARIAVPRLHKSAIVLEGRRAGRGRDPGDAPRRRGAAFPRDRDLGRALGRVRHRSRCRRPRAGALDLLAARRKVLRTVALSGACRDGEPNAPRTRRAPSPHRIRVYPNSATKQWPKSDISDFGWERVGVRGPRTVDRPTLDSPSGPHPTRFARRPLPTGER